VKLDRELVRALLREQFPQWADLAIEPVRRGGWDNRSFRVGADLVARLPSHAAYAAQPPREHRWLPYLAPQLPLPVPAVVALGQPGCGYPWPWSVRRWIEGRALESRGAQVAASLGRFLAALQAIDAAGGPAPGAHNFHRGGELEAYSGEVRRALVILEGRVAEHAALALWNEAASTRRELPPAWVHGDVAPGNLLERDGRLAAVIDFGNLAVGDPACDLAIAWTWLEGPARDHFRAALAPDEATWLRGRAWALWKALVVAAGMSPTTAVEHSAPFSVVARCLEDR
jgi:aminoglycoside phosphotransferase (APT) family kinase protein